MYVFKNKQPRMLGTCTGRRLKPGKTELDISEKEFQKIVSDEQFKGWAALGWVSYVLPQQQIEKQQVREEYQARKTTETPESLEELKLPEAKIVIEKCSDGALLADWYDKDERKGVKETILAKMQDLGLLDDLDLSEE